MTSAQRTRFYFPAWGQACRALDWHMAGGRFAARRRPQHGSPEVDALYQSVWTIGEQLSVAAHAALKPDHLRHACHVVALGKDKSANELTNAELDQVVNLFRLLAEPDDIDAIIRLQHPEKAEKERLVYSLRKRAPQARLLAIAKNLHAYVGEWESPFWEDLPLAGLKALSAIIGQEQRHWNSGERKASAASTSARAAAMAGTEEPF